jgi:regulation of enolase protein 1 (concanavalin A-like superfamily)
MRPNANHIQSALLRAITAQAGIDTSDRQKTILVVESVCSDDWASATFVGATHQLDLRLEGDREPVQAAVAALHAGLAEREIPINGHIVAEIGVCSANAIIADNMITVTLTVNALTIID